MPELPAEIDFFADDSIISLRQARCNRTNLEGCAQDF